MGLPHSRLISDARSDGGDGGGESRLRAVTNVADDVMEAVSERGTGIGSVVDRITMGTPRNGSRLISGGLDAGEDTMPLGQASALHKGQVRFFINSHGSIHSVWNS